MKGVLYTWIAAYGGAAAAIFYPFIGLLIYINFSIIKPESMWYWSVGAAGPGQYSRIVGIAMLIGWLMKGIGDWKLGAGWPVTLIFLAYLAWGMVGWGCCNVPALAQSFVISMIKIILPFLIGMTLIDSMARLKQLAWVLALSQGYVAYELNLSYYAGVNRVAREGFGGMDNNSVAIAMVTGVGLAFFLALGERNIWMKTLGFLSSALMAHVVMFSWSRGGMLALIVMGVCSFFLIPRRSRSYLIFVVAVLLAYRLAGDQVRERFVTVFVEPEERDRSASARLEYWGYCWEAMKSDPILGLGPNHWQRECEIRGRSKALAHSVWFQVGAEMGFPGMALLIAFYAVSMMQLWPLTRGKTALPDPWIEQVGRGVIAAFIGFCVSASFVSLTGLEYPYYIGLLGAAALKLTYAERRYGLVQNPVPMLGMPPRRAAPEGA